MSQENDNHVDTKLFLRKPRHGGIYVDMATKGSAGDVGVDGESVVLRRDCPWQSMLVGCAQGFSRARWIIGGTVLPLG